MTDPNSERLGKPVRKHIRIDVRLEVGIRVEGDGTGRTYGGETINISRGGVCVAVHEGKEELIEMLDMRMPRLKISLALRSDDAPISVQTRTTWINSKVGWFMTPSSDTMPALVGMAFEELTERDAGKIDLFIEELITSDRESVSETRRRILSRLDSKKAPE